MASRRAKRKPPTWRPPPLTEDQILAWADAAYAATGHWPQRNWGRLTIPASGGEHWSAVIAALATGGRGLPGGSSLPRLLAKHRGVRNRKGLPRLSRAKILAWADAYRARTGAWPRQESRAFDIPESPHDGWGHIDDAMRRGLRGLPGGDSLARLLAEKRGVRNPAELPPLKERQILRWADDYHARSGRWPGHRVWREEIPHSDGETWLRVDLALKMGLRGLPGGETLAGLLARTGRCRNVGKLPALTDRQILRWARTFRRRHGQWPTCRATPQAIPGTFGEVWYNVDQALRKGLRGLSGGSSLRQLLAASKQ